MCSHFWDCIVARCYLFLLISFFLSSVLVSFSSLFSLLSHFSSITPSHPSFILSISPSQPTLTIFFLKAHKKHLNIPTNYPKTLRQNPYRHYQIALCKSYLKPRKTPLQSHRNPTKKQENQHKKIPKTSLKIPRKYQKNKNTEKNSFQNPENQS